MICASPSDASSNELADWIELEVLSSNPGVAFLTALNENLEIDEDYEPDELDEEDLSAERRLQQAATAIQERISTIGDAYPFEIDAAGKLLRLKEPLTEGACTYLFCLIVSNGAKGGFLAADGPWRPDLTQGRELFQICATVSAGGCFEGPAFSVGWPRPDSSSFLAKLDDVYKLMKDGVVHKTVPPGAPAQVKDDEIDVIAWKQPVVAGPGNVYLLGQAASGANWGEKSLKGVAETFHGTWFSQTPASQVTVATIIPFVLPTSADAGDHEEQADIEGRRRRTALEHGLVLFRHRVARYVSRAVEIVADGVGPIERITELSRLCDYVLSYRQQLQLAIDGLK